VDGKEKYRSNVYKIGQHVLPVIVDIQGSRMLTLVTENGGNGIDYDYGWWAEARLIKK